MSRKDPKVGTGKKPKGSGRRLYTDENPKDTVPIKYATQQDARDTVKRVKNVNKPFARKIQILTVMEQRAKVAGKKAQAEIARRGKEAIRRQHERKAQTKGNNCMWTKPTYQKIRLGFEVTMYFKTVQNKGKL